MPRFLHASPAIAIAVVLATWAAIPAPASSAPPSLTPSERSWALLLGGSSEEAAASSERVLTEDPTDLRAVVCLAEALTRAGRTRSLSERGPHPGETGARDLASILTAGTTALLGRDFAHAEERFREALERMPEKATPDDRLVILERLGTALREAGKPDEAEPYLTEALGIARALDRPVAMAWLHYGIGYTRLHVGRTDEGEKELDLALEGASTLELHEVVGDAQLVLSLLPRWRMDLARSRSRLQAAMQAYRKTGNLSRQAACQRHLGASYLYGGEMVDAVRSLLSAQELAAEAGDRVETSRALADLGQVDLSLGDPGGAVARWREALDEGADVWPPEWTGAYQLDVATALMDLGRFDESIPWLERAKGTLEGAAHRRDLAEVYTGFARVFRETDRREEAIRAAEEAVRIAREWKHSLAECNAWIEMGNDDLALGRLEAAERSFRDADSVASASDFVEARIAARTGEARIARARGRPDDALRSLEGGIEIAEDRRRLSRGSETIRQKVFGTSLPLFIEAIDLLEEASRAHPDSGFDRRAFQLAERSRARSLLDLLSEAQVDLRLHADPAFRERERALIEQTGDPDRDEDLMLLEADLRAADPRYAEVRYPKPTTAAEVQERLRGDGVLLLEYLLGDEASFAWAVTGDSLRMERLPPRDEITAGVRAVLPLLTDYNLLGSDPAYLRAPAEALSRMLLDPFAPEVKKARRIIVVPDGVLHFLPFEVLPFAPGGDGVPGGGWTSFPFLVKRVDVSYVPSASTLTWVEGEASPAVVPPGGTELLLVGDPVPSTSGGDAVYLRSDPAEGERAPFVREEVAALLGLFNGKRVRVLTGAEATPSRVSEEGAKGYHRLVHFASHGVFNERSPRFSGLLLSPDSEGDGFLSLADVFALNLPCDQVILSACSSALGEPVTGEGVVGLTRGFLYAGARSVVASLWEVSGESTGAIMRRIYGELEKGRADRAAVLGEAKRSFAAGAVPPSRAGYDEAHPYFWAPFILVGDPGGR